MFWAGDCNLDVWGKVFVERWILILLHRYFLFQEQRWRSLDNNYRLWFHLFQNYRLFRLFDFLQFHFRRLIVVFIVIINSKDTILRHDRPELIAWRNLFELLLLRLWTIDAWNTRPFIQILLHGVFLLILRSHYWTIQIVYQWSCRRVITIKNIAINSK